MSYADVLVETDNPFETNLSKNGSSPVISFVYKD